MVEFKVGAELVDPDECNNELFLKAALTLLINTNGDEEKEEMKKSVGALTRLCFHWLAYLGDEFVTTAEPQTTE